jgi:hypothetical protein
MTLEKVLPGAGVEGPRHGECAQREQQQTTTIAILSAQPGYRQDVPAAWSRRAQEYADWVMRCLVNRDDIYGRYVALADRAKLNGNSLTMPSRERRGLEFLTRDIVVRHAQATAPEHVIGLHTTSQQNTSRWGAIEIDWHEEGEAPPETRAKLWAAALHWFNILTGLGFFVLLIDSNGRGGYHIWFLFESSVSTPELYAFLRTLVSDYQQLGLEKCPEIFPKQASIKPGGNGQGQCGNWLRIFGRHHTSDHYSKVWDGAAWLEGDQAIDFILSIPRASPDLLPKSQDPAAVFLAASGLPSAEPKAPPSKRKPEEEIAFALAALEHVSHQRAVSYDDWLAAGMALHSVDQSQAMLDRWDEWSRKCVEKFEEGACAKKWATFNKSGGIGIGSLIHWAKETGWAPGKKVYQSALSRFVFQLLYPRVSQGGRISFQLCVVQNKRTIFLFQMTGARRAQKEVVSDLVRKLQLTDSEKVELENILEKFVAAVPGEAARAQEEAIRGGESISQIVFRHLRTLEPKYQDGFGAIFFERRGLLRRHELVGVTPQLVDECRGAVDVPPANSKGIVPLPSLLRAVKAAIEVGWGDLLQTLGPPPSAQLLHTSRAAQEFRVALNSVFKKTGTWEVNGTFQKRASLASKAGRFVEDWQRAMAQSSKQTPPRRWSQVIDNVDGCWILLAPDRKTAVWTCYIGIRFDLPIQIGYGLSLPNVSSQDDLFKLGVMFGVVDPHPPVRAKIKNLDLAVLTNDFTEALLGAAQGSDEFGADAEDQEAGAATKNDVPLTDAQRAAIKKGREGWDAEMERVRAAKAQNGPYEERF